jgi:protoporphyrinogen oxidase
MSTIVIIGAGLTGLSTAYHLEQSSFFDYHFFEKEQNLGGLCRTIKQDGFTFDYTGHLLHISDPYFRSFIQNTIGFDQLHSIQRRSFIYSHNTYTHYPFQINLFGLPRRVITECITGYINRKTSIRKPKNFIQWVHKNFGTGFGNHFFFPFQKKLFAYDLRAISASWTGRFVPSTSLEQIIEGALYEPAASDVGYNAQFFYPKQDGIVAWLHTIAQHIKNPIHYAFCVKAIDMQKKIVHFTNGHSQAYDVLITTMPLDILLQVLIEKPTTFLKQALPYLRCNSVINFNLGINRPALTTKHWIYFPDPQFPFYRLGFPHNFAESNTPAGCSSLYGEFSFIRKPQSWTKTTLDTALAQTQKLFKIADQDIITKAIIYIPHAYVIYNQWRDQHIAALLNHLEENHIYSIGRYGAWKYASMQEAVLDGKKMADSITSTPI